MQRTQVCIKYKTICFGHPPLSVFEQDTRVVYVQHCRCSTCKKKREHDLYALLTVYVLKNQ